MYTIHERPESIYGLMYRPSLEPERDDNTDFYGEFHRHVPREFSPANQDVLRQALQSAPRSLHRRNRGPAQPAAGVLDGHPPAAQARGLRVHWDRHRGQAPSGRRRRARVHTPNGFGGPGPGLCPDGRAGPGHHRFPLHRRLALREPAPGRLALRGTAVARRRGGHARHQRPPWPGRASPASGGCAPWCSPAGGSCNARTTCRCCSRYGGLDCPSSSGCCFCGP